VEKLECKRCNNVWTYKGKNQYCANCSRCKSTVFIKKVSLSAEKRDLYGSGGLDSNRRREKNAVQQQQQQQVAGKIDSDFAVKE
jgi:hypothetical protein